MVLDIRKWINIVEGLKSETFFHGTSEYTLNQILQNNNKVLSVYTETNKSLGGAYLTIYKSIAKAAAMNASRQQHSSPIILTIKKKYPLYPDEDWVVELAENPSETDFNWDKETYSDENLNNFFNDLFSDYMGEGFSLSDEYARRYDELNNSYGIDYTYSLKYIGSVRQKHLITKDQILNVEKL